MRKRKILHPYAKGSNKLKYFKKACGMNINQLERELSKFDLADADEFKRFKYRVVERLIQEKVMSWYKAMRSNPDVDFMKLEKEFMVD